MVRIAHSSKMSLAMIRFASFPVTAFALMFTAAAACAQASPPDPADLLTRITRLQETIRNLTGMVEELQYHNQQLEQTVARLQQEVEGGARPPSGAPPRPGAEYSPPPSAPYAPPPGPQYAARPSGQSALPAAAPPPPGPVATAEPAPLPPAPIDQPSASGRRGDAFDPSLNPNAPGVPRPLGSSTAANEPPPVSDAPNIAPAPRQPGAPLDLSNLANPSAGAAPNGQLPPPPPANPSATGATVATLPPSSSPRDEYDHAYGYILHKDYKLAADAFNAFLREYPSDRLAPEAQYWLGEALFQTQNYHDAAEAFLAVSTKYETTARAPDALLRLGESLAALGEKEAACASLGEVLRKYPRASLSVKQSVDRDQKRVHC